MGIILMDLSHETLTLLILFFCLCLVSVVLVLVVAPRSFIKLIGSTQSTLNDWWAGGLSK